MSAESKTSQTAVSKALVPESFLSRVVVAPVLFVTFVLSLVLIDRRTHDTVFSHNLNSERSSSPQSQNTDSGDYYHSNQRKLARQEIEDAFQIRSKVIAGFVIFGGVVVAIVGWVGSRAVNTFVVSSVGTRAAP